MAPTNEQTSPTVKVEDGVWRFSKGERVNLLSDDEGEDDGLLPDPVVRKPQDTQLIDKMRARQNEQVAKIKAEQAKARDEAAAMETSAASRTEEKDNDNDKGKGKGKGNGKGKAKSTVRYRVDSDSRTKGGILSPSDSEPSDTGAPLEKSKTRGRRKELRFLRTKSESSEDEEVKKILAASEQRHALEQQSASRLRAVDALQPQPTSHHSPDGTRKTQSGAHAGDGELQSNRAPSPSSSRPQTMEPRPQSPSQGSGMPQFDPDAIDMDTIEYFSSANNGGVNVTRSIESEQPLAPPQTQAVGSAADLPLGSKIQYAQSYNNSRTDLLANLNRLRACLDRAAATGKVVSKLSTDSFEVACSILELPFNPPSIGQVNLLLSGFEQLVGGLTPALHRGQAQALLRQIQSKAVAQTSALLNNLLEPFATVTYNFTIGMAYFEELNDHSTDAMREDGFKRAHADLIIDRMSAMDRYEDMFQRILSALLPDMTMVIERGEAVKDELQRSVGYVEEHFPAWLQYDGPRREEDLKKEVAQSLDQDDITMLTNDGYHDKWNTIRLKLMCDLHGDAVKRIQPFLRDVESYMKEIRRCCIKEEAAETVAQE